MIHLAVGCSFSRCKPLSMDSLMLLDVLLLVRQTMPNLCLHLHPGRLAQYESFNSDVKLLAVRAYLKSSALSRWSAGKAMPQFISFREMPATSTVQSLYAWILHSKNPAASIPSLLTAVSMLRIGRNPREQMTWRKWRHAKNPACVKKDIGSRLDTTVFARGEQNRETMRWST